MLVRRVLAWLLAAAAVYLVVVLAYWWGQERLIFFPGPRPGPPPTSPLVGVREEWIDTRDGERIHAWICSPRKSPAAGAVLVCHGNAGNIEVRMPLAEGFAEMGFASLLFDYRGYGASSGVPGEEGTYRDAEAAYDLLAGKLGFGALPVVVYGESLGGAIAVELALRRKVAAVVLEDTFTSMVEIASKLYPWLPVRLVLRSRYDTIHRIARLGVPLLVIHSPEDDLIPFAHGEKLFAAAREPKRFLSTSGLHEDRGFLQEPEWRAEVRDFLAAAR